LRGYPGRVRETHPTKRPTEIGSKRRIQVLCVRLARLRQPNRQVVSGHPSPYQPMAPALMGQIVSEAGFGNLTETHGAQHTPPRCELGGGLGSEPETSAWPMRPIRV